MTAPVHSLGPGERVCLWTRGCSKHCPGCISPELQPCIGPDTDEALTAQLLIRAAETNSCSGLTISGGDPFEQAPALVRLLACVRGAFSDILVYTGFTIGELRSGIAGTAGTEALGLIDVLIDGRYIDERNHPSCVLRGSDNQTIHYLNPTVRAVYEEYMRRGRIVESFIHGNTVILTGIPNRRAEM